MRTHLKEFVNLQNHPCNSHDNEAAKSERVREAAKKTNWIWNDLTYSFYDRNEQLENCTNDHN
jgi:hypothetical protein